MLSTWKVEGEYGQECCKIGMSDLNCLLKASTFSFKDLGSGRLGHQRTLQGQGRGGSAPTREADALVVSPASASAPVPEPGGTRKAPSDCENARKCNNQKSLRNDRLVPAPSLSVCKTTCRGRMHDKPLRLPQFSPGPENVRREPRNSSSGSSSSSLQDPS